MSLLEKAHSRDIDRRRRISDSRLADKKKYMGPKRFETLVRRSEITIETMTVTRIRRVTANFVNDDPLTDAISEIVSATNEPPILLDPEGNEYEK